jgi:hypothetical protein
MPVTIATVDLERVARRYSALQLRFAGLQGRAKELQLRQTSLVREISLAKARIDLAPAAMEAFTYLQEQAHARAVGDFEELLSAFAADVVPDAGKIRLELGTDRGAPSLEILVDNGGDLEGILKGNGGGLTNVVVTGLGFSALARTANRQLMLLDEPDCWLKAKNVPSFTKVIAEVANPRLDADGVMQPGCQTLMISHNDISLMDEGAHIQDLQIERSVTEFAARCGVAVNYVGEVSLCAYVVWVPGKAGTKDHIEVRYRNDPEADDEQNALTKGFPYIQSIGGARAWADDMPGLRWIEVENVSRHVKTRLELSPGLNVLAGDVNCGKSTLYFTALRAVAYGESDDTMIRHGADSAIVRLGLENNVVVELVRKRKGGPKAEYFLYESGVRTHKQVPENKGEKYVPEFVTKALRVSRVDGLDVQLRSQKEPIFLLNETPGRRAQLLSVGRESGLLQAVIERHRLKNRRDKEQVKRDEIELNLVNRTLTLLSPLGSMAALVELMDASLEEARAAGESLQGARTLVARLAPLESKVKLLAAVGDQLSAVPEAPVFVPTAPLTDLVSRLERTHILAQVPDLPTAPVAPVPADTRQLQALLVSIEQGQYAGELESMLPAVPVAPSLADTGRLQSLLTAIEKGQQAAALEGLLPSAPELAQLADTGRLTSLITAIGKGQTAAAALGLLPQVPELPLMADTTDLRHSGVALSKQAEAITTLEKDEKAAVAEATAADEAEHALKHELGVCPACDRAFEGVSHV